MQEFQAAPKRDLNGLHEVATRQYRAYVEQHGEPPADQSEIYLTLLICRYEQGRTVVYGIEPHNDFKLTERVLNTPMDFAIWSGGIRVHESSTAAMAKFRETMNVVQTFQHAFDEIAYEAVGGELTVYQMDKGVITPFMHTKINEKPGMKWLTEDIVRAELLRLRSDMIVAETVVGQLGSFVSTLIGEGNDVVQINTHGIAAGNADFNSAPFRVNMQGDVIARSIKLTGEVKDSEVIASVIRASQIIGGSISSDTDIDVTRDARIGNNLFMGLAGSTTDRRIEFVDPNIYEAFISFAGGTKELKIRAGNDIRIDTSLDLFLKGDRIMLQPGSGGAYIGSSTSENRIVVGSEMDYANLRLDNLGTSLLLLAGRVAALEGA